MRAPKRLSLYAWWLAVLAKTGQVEQLNISFPQVLEVAQRLELTFEVAYTLNFVDQVPQLLQVVYQVVPDTISNKSAVSTLPLNLVLNG